MNTSLGLDIGSRNIKLIELVKEPAGPRLLAAGSIPTPPKALSSDLSGDTESIAVAIKKLVRDTGVKSRSATIALPESQVFTRVIEMPPLSTRELTSALQWEAEQYIPLPLDQVSMDSTVLRDATETGTNKMDVLLVAAPKTLLDKYMTYLELADLTPSGVETEIIAVSRSLLASIKTVKSVMVVSLGALTTDLAILRGGILAFTRSMSAGGDALTRAISQGLGLELTQAEEYKKTYGLEPDKLEGKIVAAAKPVMDTLVSEMKRAVTFYQQKFKTESIDVMLLSGGSARIPGMVVYIAQNLGMNVEVQLANPWIGIVKDARFNVLDTEGTLFAVAIGLALR